MPRLLDLPAAACKHCIFSSEAYKSTDEYLRCRANPPKANDLGAAIWPLVISDDVCGGFKRKHPERKAKRGHDFDD